jgi:hypothetical protein
MGVSVQAQTGGQAEYIKAVKRSEIYPQLLPSFFITFQKIYPMLFPFSSYTLQIKAAGSSKMVTYLYQRVCRHNLF